MMSRGILHISIYSIVLQVQELQKECINKRRRANLPNAAKEVFGKW